MRNGQRDYRVPPWRSDRWRCRGLPDDCVFSGYGFLASEAFNVETLSDFFASAVEFLVGGILFIISVAFLLSAGYVLPDPNGAHKDLLVAYSTLITTVFVAAAYAMGVVAESLARSPFEPLLDRITVRTEAFLPDHGAGVTRQAPASGTWSARRNRIIELCLGDDFTVDHRKAARAERERQRMKVMTCETLHAEVQGQLKRLRLERVSALCFFVIAAALLIRGHWQFAALMLASTAGMVWVVNTRFRRFCGAIVRTYDLLIHETPPQKSQGLSTSA
jgi:hypothetical protein